jgi:hypothetical protein
MWLGGVHWISLNRRTGIHGHVTITANTISLYAITKLSKTFSLPASCPWSKATGQWLVHLVLLTCNKMVAWTSFKKGKQKALKVIRYTESSKITALLFLNFLKGTHRYYWLKKSCIFWRIRIIPLPAVRIWNEVQIFKNKLCDYTENRW